MNRRESIVTLSALSTLPIGVYASNSSSKAALMIESGDEESRFKIGQDAFLLRPKSQILLEHDGVGTKLLRLIAGGMMAVFGAGEKTIQTKTFTAGIRGTGIYLQEYAPDAIYSCLCYGKADYRSEHSLELLLSMETIYHDQPIQIRKSHTGKLDYIDFKEPNHNDDELRALEKMCDRTVPFEAYLHLKALQGGGNSY